LKTAEEEDCVALGIDIDSAATQSGGNWGALERALNSSFLTS